VYHRGRPLLDLFATATELLTMSRHPLYVRRRAVAHWELGAFTRAPGSFGQVVAYHPAEEQMPGFYVVRLPCPLCMSSGDPTMTTRGWHPEEVMVLTPRQYARLVRQHARRCRAGRRRV
jgi:hypothetical protein